MARYDRNQREPRRYLFGVYALGMFSVVPAAFLEMLGSELVFGPLEGSPTQMVLAAFFLIGPVEEVCKYLAVKSIYESDFFQDPLDGVVYSTAAAMGFASLENALYVTQLGWQVFWLRAILAIPGHLVFAAFWGYQLGRRKFGLGGNVALGLALAAFAHGLYDALLMAQVVWLAWGVLPLMAGMAWLFRRQMRELWQLAVAYRGSRPAEGQRWLRCDCGARFRGGTRCPKCGSEALALICGHCEADTSWRQPACAGCGRRFADAPAKCGRCANPYPPYLQACPFCDERNPSPSTGDTDAPGMTSS